MYLSSSSISQMVLFLHNLKITNTLQKMSFNGRQYRRTHGLCNFNDTQKTTSSNSILLYNKVNNAVSYFCKFNICQDLSCLFFAPCQLASLAFSNLQYSCFHNFLHSLGYSNQLLPVSPYKSLMRYYLSFPLFKTCQMRISMNLFKYQNKPQGKIFLNVNFKINAINGQQRSTR